jgi:predicted porin
MNSEKRKKRGSETRTIGLTCAGVALSLLAMADSSQAQTMTQPAVADAATKAPPAASADSALTFYGITLYGTYDIGVAYQTHGAPSNRDFPTGLNYLVSKTSNKSVTAFAPNGLSQSKIGLKGSKDLNDQIAALFVLETGFSSTSLHLADGPASMVSNNGVSATSQSSNGDSSRAGQIFNGAAYVGLKSKDFGQLAYGRQNGLLLDNILAYDPQGGSYAFSVIGYSGAAAGIGNTQDARLDASLKYTGKFGPVRVGLQYQPSGTSWQIGSPAATNVGSAQEFDLGGDYGALSADLLYSHKNSAIGAGPLSSKQLATAGIPSDSLSATISDTTSYSIMGKYKLNKAGIFAGYEHIEFKNPSSPVPVGTIDVGGYVLGAVNNTAFPNAKVLQIFWTGVRYAVSDSLNVTGAYYRYEQNSYDTVSCSDTSSGKCSGQLNAYSVAAVYKIDKHFDAYAGAMWSGVQNGLANGYAHTSTIDPMIGLRASF